MELRRRAPRIKTDWSGRCMLGGNPEPEVNECRVTDISLLGVGIEIVGERVDDLVGQCLIIEVEPPVGKSVRLHLSGQVMNQGTTSEGLTRVGLQFVGLSETERSILEVIEQLKIFW